MGNLNNNLWKLLHYDPRWARPATRVDLAAPFELLFPFAGIGALLPVVVLPFFLSLFLLVLNSDIYSNLKGKVTKACQNRISTRSVQYNELPVINVYLIVLQAEFGNFL